SRASRCVLCWVRYFTRAWDEALEGAEAIIAECEAGAPMYFEYHPRLVRARITLARGGNEKLVLEDVRRAVEIGDAVKDPQARVQTLSHSTIVSVELGRLEEARATVAELVELLPLGGTDVLGASEVAWVAEMLGAADALRTALAATPVWLEPYKTVLDRDFERAAELFAALGLVDEGYARFKAGEKLLAEGRASEADAQLRKALAFFRSLGATRYIRKTEALLTKAGLEIPA
ncbi:MAG: hypothetical protein M3364_02710, partial [Actinomycetota bacterium]|nr:hypothetical protein [Actinomycetota bacterium]